MAKAINKRDANNNPVLIIIISIIFVLGGGAAAIAALINGGDDKSLLLIIGSILFAVGIVLLIFGILTSIKLRAIRNLLADPKSFTTEAKFIKSVVSGFSSTSISSGGIGVPTSMNVFKKIWYKYVDEEGNTQTVKSSVSYVPKQVEYLEKKGTFQIKCKGKLSIITEELPEMNDLFNL